MADTLTHVGEVLDGVTQQMRETNAVLERSLREILRLRAENERLIACAAPELEREAEQRETGGTDTDYFKDLCIAAIAIRPEIGRAPDGVNAEDWFAVRRFLLGKSGWWGPTESILFGSLEGGALRADPYDWPECPRTMRAAHLYAEGHFEALVDGAVIDVRVPLGLRQTPVESDRFFEFSRPRGDAE